VTYLSNDICDILGILRTREPSGNGSGGPVEETACCSCSVEFNGRRFGTLGP